MSWVIPTDIIQITMTIDIAQMTMTIVLAVVFFALYWNDKRKYILIWALGWFIWTFRFVFQICTNLGHNHILFIILGLFSWVYGSLLLSYGTLVFLNKKAPSLWIVGVIIIEIWIVLSVLLHFDPMLQQAPVSIFLGFTFLYTGIAIFYSNNTGTVGKTVAICSFLTLAVHYTNLPFIVKFILDYITVVHQTPIFIILGVTSLLAATIIWRSKNINKTVKYISTWSLLILGLHCLDYPLLAALDIVAPIAYIISAVTVFFCTGGVLLMYNFRIRKELAASEEKFRLLAENAKDFIYRFAFLPNRVFQYVSPSVVDITGYTTDEFYSDPNLYLKLIHPDDKLLITSQSTFVESTHTPLALRWVKKNKEIIWVELNSSPIYGKDGSLVAIEGIARDITERKQNEEKIARLDVSRRHLISSISHELRTPLTSMQGYIEAMVDGVITKPEEKIKYLNLALDRIVNLNRLIQDLFQLSHLEARQLSFAFYPTSINKLIEEIYNRFKDEVQFSDIDFVLVSDNESCLKNIEVNIDYDRIMQIFTNLISNSIKHTPKGGQIELSYYMFNDKYVVLKVSDNGHGINSQDLPNVFKRFYKSSDINKSSIKGHGLGLSITKELTEAHGGEIWVDSTLGQGSSFYFSLPTL